MVKKSFKVTVLTLLLACSIILLNPAIGFAAPEDIPRIYSERVDF
ncbi:hypothetical protein J2Z35_001282 [Acetoanaerobium pronyense]|uniref:Uncharacterized protein n=1 Tax=Acetoanaerobium pronyense TaxID=1482736 RepID=A0ABS4KIA3_9FIRM|nr:hypothetical protein [Acetoanaerobium pronyense]MBP2027485.1 hypothetical protein [Acetoanaerobium pronyense]